MEGVKEHMSKLSTYCKGTIEHICNHLNFDFNKMLLISAQILMQPKTSEHDFWLLVCQAPSDCSIYYPICLAIVHYGQITENPASCNSNHCSATSTSSSPASCNSGWHHTIFTRCWRYTKGGELADKGVAGGSIVNPDIAQII